MPGADPWPLLGAAAAVGLAVWAATGLLLRLLTRLRLYDRPNERSSHAVATPRGGGLALVPLLLAAWIAWGLWSGTAPAGLRPAVLGTVLLALVSLADDLRGLPAVLRLAVQAGAVGLGLIGLGEVGPVFQGLLPPLADRLAAAFLWLWFLNLFNFMDGIDGISGVEAASVGLGLAMVALLGGLAAEFVALPVLLAAAALGFLAWNRPPAKLFLGDVGSVPLGYLLGWLLLSSAAAGQWAAALILPLYYLADATVTLAKRGLRGAKVWQAHREHFYQRAVQGGLSHGAVVLRVLVCNAALVVFALLATAGWPWAGLAGAALAVLVLLARLEHHAAGRCR
jgi:UDP-N-acetylmuramyl pentapeptide phosphotransferase/UDP-N-acetylglucosamine-1-phosphate transferase